MNGSSVRKRTIKNLKEIRAQIAEEMPGKTANKTLILGTWNIRNFDDNRFGHGPRLEESFYYIAEIISAFDVLAVQEINENLKPLNEVMNLLGEDYEYILTDITEGRSGNRERLGFIYNKKKVDFKGVAGEVVLPNNKLISDATQKRQFARTPFTCSFQSGWFKFMFATVHIYYGASSTSSDKYKRRVKEIKKIASTLKKRADKEKTNYVLVGDFNIDTYDSDAYDALEKAGFTVFKNKTGSNQKKNKFYDQISFKVKDNQLKLTDSEKNRGVLDIFKNLFSENDFTSYKKYVKQTIDANIKENEELLAEETSESKKEKLQKKIDKLKALKNNNTDLKKYYMGEWRTYQLSDHFPLWVDLEIDFSGEYLDYLETIA